MVDQGPNASGIPAHDSDEADGVDLEQLVNMVVFVFRAARRRWKLVLFTFLTVATVGVTAAITMPRTYTAQVRLLAQRSSAIHILGGALPQMDAVDNPTKNVSSMIMRRDNLVALVRDADLVDRIAATRPRALRLKDRVIGMLFGAPSPEDMQQS